MEQKQKIFSKCLELQENYQLKNSTQKAALKEIDDIKKTVEKMELTETSTAFINQIQQTIAQETTIKNSRSRNVTNELEKYNIPQNALPMRYIPKALENHVAPLPIHFNGLIHGAIIKKENYNIVCYAHRWFYHKTERYGKKFRGSKSIYKEEIAGLYEKYNKDGISLGLPIRNVNVFNDIFVNASSPSYLDKNCKSILSHFGPRKRQHLIMENTWFYLPNDQDETDYFKVNPERNLTSIDIIYNKFPYKSIEEPLKISHQDSFNPSKFINNKHFDDMFYPKDNPVPQNLLSQVNTEISSEATSGFVVNSPYIKVFSLGSKYPETIISILNSTRTCKHNYYGNKGGTKEGEHKSNWMTHIVK